MHTFARARRTAKSTGNRPECGLQSAPRPDSDEEPPMKLHRLFAIAIAVALLPGIAAAQKTTYDFDKTAPFSTFKTYALKDGTKTGNELIDKRVINAIETQMTAKGFTKND